MHSCWFVSSAHIGLYIQPILVLVHLSLCSEEMSDYICRPIIDSLNTEESLEKTRIDICNICEDQ